MKTTDLTVIELKGTPRDRGRVYGEMARSLIASTVELWQAELGSFGVDRSSRKCVAPDAYIREFLSQTGHMATLAQWAPELLEEIQGIAEGAGQTIDNISGLQLLDEEWMFGMNGRLSRPTDKCTAFGVYDQGGNVSFAGQNMDLGSWVDSKQVLLRIISGGKTPEALVFSIAGNTGLNGLNASGLGLTCNTLAQLNYASRGLPVSAIIRVVLSMSSIDEAEAFLHRVPHASGQNYILSSAGDIRCFECSSNRVVRYRPEENPNRIFHSNHPLVNTDENTFLEPDKRLNNSTVARLVSISSRLGDTSQPLSLAAIKAALAAHDDPDNPVSRNINKEGSAIGYTAGSSIYEFGELTRLHLAAGPPCETDFEVFDFKTPS